MCLALIAAIVLFLAIPPLRAKLAAARKPAVASGSGKA
jgi:hypothetical protein